MDGRVDVVGEDAAFAGHRKYVRTERVGYFAAMQEYRDPPATIRLS